MLDTADDGFDWTYDRVCAVVVDDCIAFTILLVVETQCGRSAVVQ